MKTVGIIAEYNPFHTGHDYQLKKAKEESGADFSVIVMSPDFVQRGEPALFDKYTRTRMALSAGADLVLELPVCFACGSAEYFARGAVTLLHNLGVVDTLCFGAETADSHLFYEAAHLFNDEPEVFRSALQEHLRRGLTYPQARAAAVTDTLAQTARPGRLSGEKSASLPGERLDSLSGEKSASLPGERFDPLSADFLTTPNNILGIEYCKALLKLHSPIKPLPVRRQGSDYNSTDLSGTYCSASAIRSELTRSCSSADTFQKAGNLQKSVISADVFPKAAGGQNPGLLSYIPDSCRELFLDACRRTVTAGDFLPYLIQKLLTVTDYSHILDISPDLSDRICNLRYSCVGNSYDEIVDQLKTRQITQSRIRRVLMHLILNITDDAMNCFLEQGTAFYGRILGFRREASPLLHQIKQKGTLPLISKPAAADALLDETGRRMLKLDFDASHLYRSILTARYGLPFLTEYQMSPIVF